MADEIDLLLKWCLLISYGLAWKQIGFFLPIEQFCVVCKGSTFISIVEAIAAIIGDIVVFYNSKNLCNWKNLNCIEALYFLRPVHTFSWFLKSNSSVDFGHAETGSGAKKRVVLLRKFFRSNFKVEWKNGVWKNIRFLASGFLITCGDFTSVFYYLFSIFGSDFFSKWFSQTIHSSFQV